MTRTSTEGIKPSQKRKKVKKPPRKQAVLTGYISPLSGADKKEKKTG